MSPKRLNVLIVDDNKSDRLIVGSIVRNFLFTDIHEAEGGSEAIQKISTASEIDKAFNLILLDWNMPNGRGEKVLEYVRSEKALKNCRVIVMTATSERGVVERAIELGADDFIVKPVALDTLKEKVERILSLSK